MSQRDLTDEQYNLIDQLRLIHQDVAQRIEAALAENEGKSTYNSRALEVAQERMAEAIFWACAGVANDGPKYGKSENEPNEESVG